QFETAPILKVSNEQILTRPVSINPRARASQVELRLSASIALTVDGQSIIPEEKLTVVRTYFQDIENIAGNQEEAQIIANELRQELINQLMRRLESVPE
ncbi:MAG: LPS assembly lipoprotein LptE, partial [Pseudomonadota bacterium]|nr:LPS assembly lipoprotein LptE [Pseudomonadota bacterium]